MTPEQDAAERLNLEAGTYDVPALAALLKCSERHVRNMADAGSVPGMIRFGRLVRFHRGIVNNWLTEQARGLCRE
jgi:excisionase family DNA binding protein